MISSELKKGARTLLFENAPKIFFICLVYITVTSFVGELQFRLPAPIAAWENFLSELYAGTLPSIGLFLGSFRISGLILSLILGLMLPIIYIGFNNYCLKINRKQSGDFKDLLAGFSFFLKIMALSLITTIMVLLWSLLLIFPGIAAYYRYRQVYFILLDDPEKSVFRCINESNRLMYRRKLDLFLVDLSFLGWFILSAIISAFFPIFPILMIWVAPYYGVTLAAFYNQMMKEVTI